MSAQLQQPQNKNIRTFKERQRKLHETEQIDERHNGQESTTKKQKDQREYEKEELVDRDHLLQYSQPKVTQKKKRCKSLNPQGQFARAKLLSSIIDKIRQTKKTNLDVLGITQQSVKQKIDKLEILLKQTTVSRLDRTEERYDSRRQDRTQITEFIKNINEMPNQTDKEKMKDEEKKNQNDTRQYSRSNKDAGGHKIDLTDQFSGGDYGYYYSQKHPKLPQDLGKNKYIEQVKPYKPLPNLPKQSERAKYNYTNLKLPNTYEDNYGYQNFTRRPQVIEPPTLPQSKQQHKNNFKQNDDNIQAYDRQTFFKNNSRAPLSRPKSNATPRINFGYNSPDSERNYDSSRYTYWNPPARDSRQLVNKGYQSSLNLNKVSQASPKAAEQANSRNALGFASKRSTGNGQYCPICGRNCNCPRFKVNK